MGTFSDRPDSIWSALATRLASFASDAGAPNAVVFDVSDAVICRAERLDDEAHERVGIVVVAANDRLSRSHARRVHLKEPEAVVLVFANIYRLAVWFDGPCDDIRVEAAAHTHLAAVESLTLSLPSPNGPGAGEGRAAVRRTS